MDLRTLALVPLLAALASAAGPQSLADLPDPLVGTDSRYELSHGNTYPAVFVPFGMIGWTAQTGEGGWPYQYSKDTIHGFLATHRPSAWMSDYGAFSFMPVTGELKVTPQERAARFRHRDEDARAYRYSVLLENGVRVEMAPVRRGGVLRFTFPRAENAFIVVDRGTAGSVQIHPASNTITGTSTSIRDNFPPNFAQYFVAVFDRKIERSGTWNNGAWAGFSVVPGDTVLVRVGVSLISLDQARRNLPAGGFAQIESRARAEWERELGRIEIQGGTDAQRRTFYTALYHALAIPARVARDRRRRRHPTLQPLRRPRTLRNHVRRYRLLGHVPRRVPAAHHPGAPARRRDHTLDAQRVRRRRLDSEVAEPAATATS